MKPMILPSNPKPGEIKGCGYGVRELEPAFDSEAIGRDLTGFAVYSVS